MARQDMNSSHALNAFMVSLSNHEGFARPAVRRFMVRQAHHDALLPFAVRL